MKADAVIAAALFIAGVAVGASYRRVFFSTGAPEVFGQTEFGAAVAMACGHGFVDPGKALTPALDDFLHVKRDQLSCSDLPASLSWRRPNLTQGLYRYLMMTTALVWRVAGISWSGLTPLFGALYGLTLAAAYGLFRLIVGRMLAVAATLALMVSAVHLQSLPYLRDYAKAPFILALMLVMGLIVRPPLRPRRAIALAIAFGVTLGVGFGFRNDLLINVLPWTAVVLCCLPGPVRSNVRLKATCLAISGAAFAVVASPILIAYSQGSNSGHVVLQGFMSPFDGPLGLQPSIYSWGYVYHDEFTSTLTDSFAYRRYGHEVPFLSAEYDRAAVLYVLHIARHWPADVITRTYASVLKIVEFPFQPGAYAQPVPHGITNAGAQLFYNRLSAVLNELRGWAVIGLAAALLIIAASSVPAAFALLLFLGYFAGYPALQFDIRHFFHLEFIAWAALAFVIDRVATGIARLWHARQHMLSHEGWIAARRTSGPVLRNLVIFGGVAAILITGPVTVLRAYQSEHLRTLFAGEYLGARRELLSFVEAPGAVGQTAITVPALWQSRDRSRRVSTEYLAIELSPRVCDALYVHLAFKYEGDRGAFDHAVDAPLVDGEQSTLVLSPVYYAEGGYFNRIEIPEEDARCLTHVSRIVASETPVVLVDADFSPHWQSNTLFQTIRDWETPAWAGRLPNVYLSPPSGAAPRRTKPRAFVAPADSPQTLAPIATRTSDGTLVIKGRPETSESYITTIAGQALEAGSMLICRGIVRRGGVTVGVLLDNHWAKTVNVTAPGPFVVSLAMDTTAKYSVVLANFAHSGDNDVTISALGWLPPAGK